jgi:GT2 family glycosyltransferase
VSPTGPRVITVLMTHDGAPSLRGTLAALAAQTQPGIEVVAVDNASEDGSGALLVDLLGPDRVLLSDRDLGVPAAIDLALDSLDAQDARLGRSGPRPDDLVLILHDDLELEPDAVAHLVAVLEADERVAIVGPKLRWADDPERLQSVGATIDLTGRVDDGIDPGELDQGQRDGERRVLFVSTAGMLVRRRVLDELGRFDPRAHAFREDLDLCWRAAIAGYDVEVVPAAVGRHGALAAEHRRTGGVAALGPRYLAERNTVTALLTNYGPERLIVVIPLALIVGLAKVVGFLVTRRFADARATVSAWGWNLANLRGTFRRRREVQARRRRSDREIAPLFGRVTPRLQAYLEAMLERVVGEAAPGVVGTAETQPSAMLQGELERVGSIPPSPSSPSPTGRDLWTAGADDLMSGAWPEESDTSRADDLEPDLAVDIAASEAAGRGDDGTGLFRSLAERIRTAPVRALLPPTLLLLLFGLRDVVLPGSVRGGDLLPFPDGARLLTRHLADWHDSGAALSALDPSPAQLVLGALQWVGGDVALRALIVIAPLLAWAAAMRALGPHVPSALPRTVLALAYAASPPVLGALANGDLVTLIVAVVLPLVVIAASTVLDRDAAVERVWRRLAVAAFLLAVAIAFAPVLIIGLPLVAIAGVGHALVAVEDERWRRTLVMRSLVLATLPLPLLGPWALSLPAVLRSEFMAIRPGTGGHPMTWLALDPSGRLLGLAGMALLLGGLAGAVVVAAADVSTTHYRAAFALTVTALGLPIAAWWLDAVGTSVRNGPLLVVTAAALAGLAGLGIARAPEVLSAHPFGWRQVGVAVTSIATIVLTAAGLLHLAIDGTPGLSREEAVPTYLATLGAQPPDRVLVLGNGRDGIVWEVVPATGPDLASFGVRHDPVIEERLTAAVDDLLSGADPRAAARLGRLGVGIVLVPDGFADAGLDALLRSQAALDPLPTIVGSVSRISGAIPGAAIVRDSVDTGRAPDPTVPPRDVLATIERVASDRFRGTAGAGGDLIAAVPFGAGWRVLIDGAPVPMLNDDGLLRVLDVAPGSAVEIVATTSTTRSGLLRAQAFWALLVISLGARPPAFALRNARHRRAEGSE